MDRDFFEAFARRLNDAARQLERAARGPGPDLDRRLPPIDPLPRLGLPRLPRHLGRNGPKRRRDPKGEAGGLPVRPDRPSGLSGGAAAAMDFDDA